MKLTDRRGGVAPRWPASATCMPNEEHRYVTTCLSCELSGSFVTIRKVRAPDVVGIANNPLSYDWQVSGLFAILVRANPGGRTTAVTPCDPLFHPRVAIHDSLFQQTCSRLDQHSLDERRSNLLSQYRSCGNIVQLGLRVPQPSPTDICSGVHKSRAFMTLVFSGHGRRHFPRGPHRTSLCWPWAQGSSSYNFPSAESRFWHGT